MIYCSQRGTPKVFYDFGNNEDQEWLVEEILAHKWTNNNLELQVKWTLGDVTWELLSPFIIIYIHIIFTQDLHLLL